MSIDVSGRTAAILNVADKHSIAWAIAQSLDRAGARLALGYQNERFEKNVRELGAELRYKPLLVPCDVAYDEQIRAVFEAVDREFGRLDALVHAMAFAPREDLTGDFGDTSRDGFRIAHDVSAYSLVALARAARVLMERTGGGSVVTLTYYGSEKVVPGYNVMGVAKASLEASVRYLASELGQAGIRVNAISAGPIKTLAARGIPGFMSMLKYHEERAPLRRRVEAREIGDTALFLCSDLSSGITGTVIYVDAGYHIMGM